MTDEAPKTPFSSPDQEALADQMAREEGIEIEAIAGSRAEEADLVPEGEVAPQNELGADSSESTEE